MNADPQKRLLVLGATGAVGTLLRQVWSIDPPEHTHVIWQARTAQPGMIPFRPGAATDVFGKVDTVLSLWGGPTDLPANRTLAIEAQRIGSETGADRVLHASSIAAYLPQISALREEDPLGNSNAYGMAKTEMEHAVQVAPGPRRCCLRLGSVAGAESLARALAEDNLIRLHQFASGHGPLRSYIAPADLAKVVLGLTHLPLNDLPQALNVGAPHPVRMEALLATANRAFHWSPAPDTARETAILDTSLLQSLVPLAPNSADPAAIVADLNRLGVM